MSSYCVNCAVLGAIVLMSFSFRATTQNPQTVCAATAITTNDPVLIACHNPCSQRCRVDGFWEDEYWMVSCNCGGLWSSTCCNFWYGENGTGGSQLLAMGDCSSPACGPGGECSIEVLPNGFGAKCL